MSEQSAEREGSAVADPSLIMRWCEGSGCPAARCMDCTTTSPLGICSMCGSWVETNSGVVVGHARRDVLAELARGTSMPESHTDYDFDAERAVATLNGIAAELENGSYQDWDKSEVVKQLREIAKTIRTDNGGEEDRG